MCRLSVRLFCLLTVSLAAASSRGSNDEVMLLRRELAQVKRSQILLDKRLEAIASADPSATRSIAVPSERPTVVILSALEDEHSGEGSGSEGRSSSIYNVASEFDDDSLSPEPKGDYVIDALQKNVSLIHELLSSGKLQTSAEFDRLRRAFNKLDATVRRVEKLARVVRTVQSDHFAMIQRFSQAQHELTTDVLQLGVKVANVQNELLNSSLVQCKNANAGLEQDVALRRLDSKLQDEETRLIDLRQEVEYITEIVNQKANKSSVDVLSQKYEKLRTQLVGAEQLLNNLNSTLGSAEGAIRRLETSLPHDCDYSSSLTSQSGTILIKPKDSPRSTLVACSSDDPDWTIIQRRTTPSPDFNRTWQEYADGFGDTTSGDSYWLGLKFVHLLTRAATYELRVDMFDIFDDFYHATYDQFAVSDEESGFALSLGAFREGNSTDALRRHDGMRFSTADRDQDASSTHCGFNYASGWWFDHCESANLNGVWNIGVIWYNADTKEWLQLKRVEMKIRLRRGRCSADMICASGRAVTPGGEG